MNTSYKHLSIDEREKIMVLLSLGKSMGIIAKQLIEPSPPFAVKSREMAVLTIIQQSKQLVFTKQEDKPVALG